MGANQRVAAAVAERCRDCGRPFGPDLPRYPHTLRCRECYRQARRQSNRTYYLRHNTYRLGQPTGRKPGQANAVEFRTVAIADRIAECNERLRSEFEQLPRQLQRTCEFCRRLALDAGLLQRETCELDRQPNASGGCDRWEPRYRTDDEDD